MTARRAFVEVLPALNEWTLGDLRAHWPRLVGRLIDSGTKPLTVTVDGVLVVAVRSRCWARALADTEPLFLGGLPPSVDGTLVVSLRCEILDGLNDDHEGHDEEPWRR